MFSLRSCLFFLVASVLASPIEVSYTEHERRDVAPEGWVKGSRLHQDLTLPVRIGLTQNNLDAGRDLFTEISSPSSPSYGQHLTAEQVIEFFAPLQTSVDAVFAWLEDQGVGGTSLSANKQWIQFDATTETVEKLFNTEYHSFEHSETGKTGIACDRYHLPKELREHVDYVTPGIKMLATRSEISSDFVKRSFKKSPLPPLLPLPEPVLALLELPLSTVCDIAIIPECISTMYNITKGTKKASGNQLGIFEDLGDVYSQTDLNEFFASLAPYIPQGTHPTLDAIDGATAPNPVTSAGPESDLDFQISYPIIWPQNSILFQTDDPVIEANYTYDGFLNNFLDAIDGSYCTYSAFGETGNSPLDPPYPDPRPGGYKGALQCGVYKPTNVISISYGGSEFDLPPSYQQRQCNEFMKLGMQGVSVVVSSGDSGVAGPAGDDSANGCLGPNMNIFSPDFPANCPYITAVGATYLPPGANVYKDQEVAVTRFPSGGGFSNIYPIPSYQASAVANYFATDNPPYPYYSAVNNSGVGANGGIYNRVGRGYPDVSAVGDNVVIFTGGAPTLIGGTSASAPAWGGILTRINEERIAAGKTTIGFVNPVLYANPQVLHDITVGSNPGCGTNGFTASAGWDPVTGLGTPNYPALLSLFMGLP